jgi:hypothetical protein
LLGALAALREAFKHIPEARVAWLKTRPADSDKPSFALIEFAGWTERATEVLTAFEKDDGRSFGLEGVEVRYGEPSIMRPLPVEPTTELLIQRLPVSSDESVVRATLTELGATAITFKLVKSGDQAIATASFADVTAAVEARRALKRAQENTLLPVVSAVYRTEQDTLPQPISTKPAKRGSKRREGSAEEADRPASASSYGPRSGSARPAAPRWSSSSSSYDSRDRADRFDRSADRRPQRDDSKRRPYRASPDDRIGGERPNASPYGGRSAGSGFGIRSSGADERAGGGLPFQRRPDSSRAPSYDREGGGHRRSTASRAGEFGMSSTRNE